jgi:hypothetical protein
MSLLLFELDSRQRRDLGAFGSIWVRSLFGLPWLLMLLALRDQWRLPELAFLPLLVVLLLCIDWLWVACLLNLRSRLLAVLLHVMVYLGTVLLLRQLV